MARHIELFEDKEAKLKSGELYTQLLRGAEEGMDIVQMKVRLGIIDKLHEETEGVTLEEDEWKALKTVVEKNKWPMAHPSIVRLIEAVTEAKEIGLEQAA